MTGHMLQKQMRFTFSPHMVWNPEEESGACALGPGYLFHPWLLLSLAPLSLGISVCLMAPEWLLLLLVSRPHSRQQRREGGCQQLFQLLSLRNIVPSAYSGSCASLSLARLCHMTIPRCKGDGKEFIDADGSDDKASACNAGDLGSIPGSRRSPGEGNGNPLQ